MPEADIFTAKIGLRRGCPDPHVLLRNSTGELVGCARFGAATHALDAVKKLNEGQRAWIPREALVPPQGIDDIVWEGSRTEWRRVRHTLGAPFGHKGRARIARESQASAMWTDLGFSEMEARRIVADERRRAWARARAAGATYSEIARANGISSELVRQACFRVEREGRRLTPSPLARYLDERPEAFRFQHNIVAFAKFAAKDALAKRDAAEEVMTVAGAMCRALRVAPAAWPNYVDLARIAIERRNVATNVPLDSKRNSSA